MLWDVHGLTLEADWDGDRVGERWMGSFASRPAVDTFPDLSFSLSLSPNLPAPPAGQPQFRQTGLIEYYLDGDSVTAHFPRYGQLRLNLMDGTTEGRIVEAALETYGVFEDLVAIGLSPHLRRRGMYLIHAFAAVYPHLTPSPALPPLEEHQQGKGVLIVGPIGSGKTTTGMALLDAGWKLLSNDSPIISATTEILSYPGTLATYPDSLRKFQATQHLADTTDPQRKITFPAESVWPDVWGERATPGAILFPQIEHRTDHVLEPLPQPEALRLLVPHAIEQWDKDMIPAHLALLNELVQSTRVFRLRLGADVKTVPALIGSVVD